VAAARREIRIYCPVRQGICFLYRRFAGRKQATAACPPSDSTLQGTGPAQVTSHKTRATSARCAIVVLVSAVVRFAGLVPGIQIFIHGRHKRTLQEEYE